MAKAAMHEREAEAAKRMFPELLPAFEGKWGVFHGDGLVAVRDDFDAAAEFAYGRYDPAEFLLVELVEGPDPLAEEDDDDE